MPTVRQFVKKTPWFGHGSALLLVVAEALNVWTWVVGAITVLAVAFYTTGLWNWAGNFQHKQKHERPKQDRRLRLAVCGLFLATSAVMFAYYHELFPISISEQQALIQRYRYMFERTEIPNKTTLIELTNSELRSKGTNVYRGIHKLNDFYGANVQQLRQKQQRGEIDKPKLEELIAAEESRAATEFAREWQVDAALVLRELRNRIPREARKHIVGLPGIKSADPRDGVVSLYDVLPTPFNLFASDLLAREIEQLVKLLPDR
jgi:hypothetical protein